jgi:NADPH:quinone reductase-like Zn-dependent oxidoreductase
MKAAVSRTYGSPDVCAIEDVPAPVPRENEVLVRVHAARIGAADSAFRQGSPAFSRLFFGLRRPKWTILGSDFAGVIETVGSAVTRFHAGDEVFGITGPDFGAHAEYVCLPEDAAIAAKPANLGFAEAVAVIDGTALPFLRDKANLQAGQHILINGASGSVGTAAVQLAKHFGAHVTGVCSTSNLDLVRSLGADAVIDYTKDDFTRTARTYDVIFDAAGKSSFARCRRTLSPAGIYLTTVPALGILIQMPWTSAFGSKKAIIAFTGLRAPAQKAGDLLFVKELAEAGRIGPVIDASYPFEHVADAHRHVDRGKRGNVVITMTNHS